MAKDPVLNEALILAQLRDETTPFTPNTMRMMCGLVIMACWDRKLDRDFFGDILDQVALINIDLADMECIGRLRQLIVAKEGDPKPLDEQSQAVIAGFMAKRRVLADKMDLISQCPTSADNIH